MAQAGGHPHQGSWSLVRGDRLGVVMVVGSAAAAAAAATAAPVAAASPLAIWLSSRLDSGHLSLFFFFSFHCCCYHSMLVEMTGPQLVRSVRQISVLLERLVAAR
jgi:hypothetical protein